MGFWEGSGISCTICKQSAPCSGQITERLVKLSMIFIIIILFAQYYNSMHICVNTIWKSRTARSDKNTNSCPIYLCWQTNTSSLNFLQLGAQPTVSKRWRQYTLFLLLCAIVTTAWYIAPSKLSVWSLSLKVQQLYLRPVKIVFVVCCVDRLSA